MTEDRIEGHEEIVRDDALEEGLRIAFGRLSQGSSVLAALAPLLDADRPLTLAGEALDSEQANLKLLTSPLPDDKGQNQADAQPWTHGPLLPVRIVLRDFAVRGLPPIGQTATARHLWDFIVASLAEATLDDYAEHLQQELRTGRG